jgi:hypothetical protein
MPRSPLSSHPLYRERYQRTKRRPGRQRDAKVPQIELARTLTEAIWHMLTRNQPLSPSLSGRRHYRRDCLTAHS